jgi:hypothetical protein
MLEVATFGRAQTRPGWRDGLVAEVFPAKDPVARFMVTVSMARNDVRHALFEAGNANKASEPDFAYWVRLSTAHFFEAVTAIRSWRQLPEVKREKYRFGRKALRRGSRRASRPEPGGQHSEGDERRRHWRGIDKDRCCVPEYVTAIGVELAEWDGDDNRSHGQPDCPPACDDDASHDRDRE